MMKKTIALLLVLGMFFMLMSSVTALKITPKERFLNYKKGDTIQIQVYVKVENENETGKYKLVVEEKTGFEWVEDEDESETIDTAGEERLLIVEVKGDDPADGNYIFKYKVYFVDENDDETLVESGDYEIEIGSGDSECGMVFFAIPVVGLIALVAIVRKR